MTGYPKSTYKNIPTAGQPHYTEAWALIESARRMADAVKDGIPEEIKDRNKVRDSLRLNWKLWTIFQAELTISENADLPDEVRQNMLTLCKFVDQHTAEILSKPTPEAIITLIDINRNIASGLLELSESEVEKEVSDNTTKEAYKPKGPQKPAAPSKPSESDTETEHFNFNEEI
ncbi:MAG: hypothetical protein COB46_00290 [Rhodospirillaceae bacterium]|nr:MAG: hypothetical protein COB46_00290 [Rhodospirillaceae bacterium]